jgi:hypothetical protein
MELNGQEEVAISELNNLNEIQFWVPTRHEKTCSRQSI